MTSTPSKAMTCWHLFGLILMSVAFGVMLFTALDKWFRGDSIVWWLVLAVVFVFAISTNSILLLKRIP
jgi:hypothetical protein